MVVSCRSTGFPPAPGAKPISGESGLTVSRSVVPGAERTPLTPAANPRPNIDSR